MLSEGWNKLVNSLAAQSCKDLGVSDAAHVSPWLQHVSIVDKGHDYIVEPAAHTPPETFATMVILLLPPKTVCNLSMNLMFNVKNAAAYVSSGAHDCHTACYKHAATVSDACPA